MAEVTQSEFDLARIRGSQEDHKRILAALEADGTVTIVDDPTPPEPEPQLDEEGNEVTDTEGNVVLQAPEATAPSPAIEIAVENVPEDEEDGEEE